MCFFLQFNQEGKGYIYIYWGIKLQNILLMKKQTVWIYWNHKMTASQIVREFDLASG